MVGAAPLVTQPIPESTGEKRIVLRSLNWQRYQTLRETLSSDRNNSLGAIARQLVAAIVSASPPSRRKVP